MSTDVNSESQILEILYTVTLKTRLVGIPNSLKVSILFLFVYNCRFLSFYCVNHEIVILIFCRKCIIMNFLRISLSGLIEHSPIITIQYSIIINEYLLAMK